MPYLILQSKDVHVKKLRLCLLREVFFLLPSHSDRISTIMDDSNTSDAVTDSVSFQSHVHMILPLPWILLMIVSKRLYNQFWY